MESEPKLGPPGAGLPASELFVARIFFALRRWTVSRKTLDAGFQRERQAIRALVRSCDAQLGGRPVLIKRLTGLEDSSRYWSVWMTLDHLRIVHREFVRVIGDLTNGVVPAGTASTAAVKPDAKVGAEVAAAYEESCDAFEAIAAGTPKLKTSVRFAHPWFGPLDAAGWHALAGAHMAIHRVQIERILEGLGQSGS